MFLVFFCSVVLGKIILLDRSDGSLPPTRERLLLMFVLGLVLDTDLVNTLKEGPLQRGVASWPRVSMVRYDVLLFFFFFLPSISFSFIYFFLLMFFICFIFLHVLRFSLQGCG